MFTKIKFTEVVFERYGVIRELGRCKLIVFSHLWMQQPAVHLAATAYVLVFRSGNEKSSEVGERLPVLQNGWCGFCKRLYKKVLERLYIAKKKA